MWIDNSTGLFNRSVAIIRDYYALEHSVYFNCTAYGHEANFSSFHRHILPRSSPSFCFRSVPKNDSNKGRGKECLLAICAVADSYGINIFLSADHEKCRDLYKDCGFKLRYDDGNRPYSMVRIPSRR